MDEQYGFGMNNNEPDRDIAGDNTDTTVSDGVYSSRHYDYSAGEDRRLILQAVRLQDQPTTADRIQPCRRAV